MENQPTNETSEERAQRIRAEFLSYRKPRSHIEYEEAKRLSLTAAIKETVDSEVIFTPVIE